MVTKNIVMKSKKEIEAFGYERCEFNDECDLCNKPQHGTYARMSRPAESNPEADYYICGKCASRVMKDGKFTCAYEARLNYKYIQ